MSLVSNEGEGEQNEIRILQDKLTSTMKLVSHLTAQLNELKEQVCTPALSWHHPRGPTLGSLRLSQPSPPLGGGIGVGPSLKSPLSSWPVLGVGVEDRSKTHSPLCGELDWGGRPHP